MGLQHFYIYTIVGACLCSMLAYAFQAAPQPIGFSDTLLPFLLHLGPGQSGAADHHHLHHCTRAEEWASVHIWS